jgi:hypothetical protein
MGYGYSFCFYVDDIDFLPSKAQFEGVLEIYSKHQITTLSYPPKDEESPSYAQSIKIKESIENFNWEEMNIDYIFSVEIPIYAKFFEQFLEEHFENFQKVHGEGPYDVGISLWRDPINSPISGPDEFNYGSHFALLDFHFGMAYEWDLDYIELEKLGKIFLVTHKNLINELSAFLGKDFDFAFIYG